MGYALSALALHSVGMVAYLVLKPNLAPLSRRLLLHLALGSSLLLPLLVPTSVPTAVPMGRAWFQPLPQHHLQAFCRCESPMLSHRMLYRTHALGKWLVGMGPLWLGMSLLLACIALFQLIREGMTLHKRVSSGRSTLLSDGIWELHLPQPHPSAAFWWGKSYLILGPEVQALSVKDREAVLAHELSHVRQRNTWEQFLLHLLAIAWCWNPVLWWMKRELRWLAECQADDAAAAQLGSRKAYAQLLLSIIDPPLEGELLSQHLGGSVMYRRLRRLLDTSPSPRKYAAFTRGAGLICLQLLLLFPVHQAVGKTLQSWDVYNQTIHSTQQAAEIVLYCPDCETVCLP